MSFPNLKYLILDGNMISSINNFPSIYSLQTLSITNNNVNDLSSFINSLRTKYPNLKSLNTFKNPMNPGIGQPQAYNQYKSYIKSLGKIIELDGKNINDSSYMSQQPQQKRDLFGTSSGSQPKRDLFGTSTNSNMFAPTTNSNMFASTNPNMNTNMNTNINKPNNMFVSTNPAMNSNYEQPSNKPKVGFFDNMPAQKTNISQSTNMSNMFTDSQMNNTPSKPVVSMNVTATGNNTSGLVYKRQFFVIDESAEIDGTEFVNSKKKKSLIMVNEKILKKSDNMTKFNRKNKSEGNKHILNTDL